MKTLNNIRKEADQTIVYLKERIDQKTSYFQIMDESVNNETYDTAVISIYDWETIDIAKTVQYACIIESYVARVPKWLEYVQRWKYVHPP